MRSVRERLTAPSETSQRDSCNGIGAVSRWRNFSVGGIPPYCITRVKGWFRMKRIKDRLNQKTRGEQLFFLILMVTALFGVLCITGCGGGQSCEKPSCGRENYDGFTVTGCSIPGCGGCLSSGKGCNTACWPQSIKIVSGSIEDDAEDVGESLKVTGCDTRYYGNGCLGCGQTEKSCYNGCITGKADDTKLNGFFYGSSDSKERIIGCYNGCGGCFGTDSIGAEALWSLESIAGVS